MLGAALLSGLIAATAPGRLNAQSRSERLPDTVVVFRPGGGPAIGREPIYYPANVLDLPDTVARAWTASVDPSRILSLGLGGEIVLGFTRTAIVDRPGPDFTVFENPFYFEILGNRRTFAEPGEVAVSADGIDFTAFPFDSLSLKGCAGVTPVNGDENPFKPEVSGGDHFDLADLGIDTVRFIRIRDVTDIVMKDRKHPFWDPTLTGFDLDAVVALNVQSRPGPPTGLPEHRDRLEVRSYTDGTVAIDYDVVTPGDVAIYLYDALGRRNVLVRRETPEGGSVFVDTAGLPPGGWFAALVVGGRLVADGRFVVAR